MTTAIVTPVAPVASKFAGENATTLDVIYATAALSEQSVRSFTTMVNTMADEVANVDSVSVADKVTYLMETYSEPMKSIKGDRNIMATIRGMLWCALAPDVVVTVKPATKDAAAVTCKAGEISQGSARHVAAQVKTLVAERDMSDAERAAADAAQAVREEKAKQAKIAAETLEQAATARRIAQEKELFEQTALAFVTAEQQRPRLMEAVQDWPQPALKAFAEELAAFMGCELKPALTKPAKR